MRKLAIYESKRLWEEDAYADLDVSLDVLRQQSVDIERYDYAADPKAFGEQPMVAKFMEVFGEAYLPLMLVDGVIVVAGRYPDDGDLINWLEFPPEVLGYEWADDDGCDCGCGCGGHHEHGEDCCGGHHGHGDGCCHHDDE